MTQVPTCEVLSSFARACWGGHRPPVCFQGATALGRPSSSLVLIQIYFKSFVLFVLSLLGRTLSGALFLFTSYTRIENIISIYYYRYCNCMGVHI